MRQIAVCYPLSIVHSHGVASPYESLLVDETSRGLGVFDIEGRRVGAIAHPARFLNGTLSGWFVCRYLTVHPDNRPRLRSDARGQACGLLPLTRETGDMPGELPRQQFVLDTSLFITEGIRRDEESLEDAVLRLLDLVATARLELNISCYVPPTVHDELTTMLRDRDVSPEVFERLDTWVVRKSPDRYGVTIPADIVYEFIDEMSDRVDRGLRVSEQALREVEQLDPDELAGGDGEYMTEADRILSDMRDEYRRALRRGVLDSREDFDLLVLARELDAGVVTEDRGIISWADEFGLRYVRGGRFPTLLAEYLRATGVDGYGDRDE